MLIIVILLAAMLVSSLKPLRTPAEQKDYLSHDCTAALEGFFVILVFLRHFQQYITLSESIDLPFKTVDSYLGQLIVVPFLFFTGYGMMLSVSKKGNDYVKAIPLKFLRLLLHFDLGILVFFLYNFFTGRKYSFVRYLWSLIGWKAVGNSNWYIFCILSFYIIVFICFTLFKKRHIIGAAAVTLSMCAFILALRFAGKSGYWYDTALVLPMGMIFFLIKEKTDTILNKHAWIYPVLMCFAVILFAVCFRYKNRLWVYLIMSCVFAGIIILLLMRFRVENPFFSFLGKHVFSIYMLQRIPVMLLLKAGISKPVNLCLSSFALTIIAAMLFEYITGHLDRILFRKKSA